MVEPKRLEPRLRLVEKVIGIPNIYLLDVAQNGTTAAVLSNETGSLQLAALPLAKGGRLKTLSHGNDRVAYGKIAHDSRRIVFSRDFGGREAHQLFQVAFRGGRERQITELPQIRVFDFSWSHGDDVIAFAGATADFNGIWLVDPESGVYHDVYRAHHWCFGPTFFADDSSLCFASKTTDVPTAFELVFQDREGTSAPAVYTPKAGSENTGPSWNPKKRKVLFKTDARGRYELAVYDPESGGLAYLQAGKARLGHDFPSFDWTPDGNRVFYLATREGRTRLYLEPVDGTEPPREVRIPKGYHAPFDAPLRMTAAGDAFVFSWSSLGRPHAVSRYDLDGRRHTVLYEHRTRLPLGRAEHIVYRSFDGLPIHSWLLRPRGARTPRPCVVWVHGGPTWEVADEWNPAIQAFLVAGYTLFAPNFRGSTGYGAEFQNLNIRDLGGGDLKDIDYAARYLRTRRDVDPRRIVIAGASYGGFMTYLALAKRPELFAAGIAIVGVTDWSEDYALVDAAMRSFDEKFMGTPEENPGLYRDRSAIHFIENVRAPLLIWHRGNDTRCPLKPIERFADRLKELGKDFEMTVVWDEGHGFQKTENLARQYKAAVDFLWRRIGPPTSGR